jgi:hypothetical protein
VEQAISVQYAVAVVSEFLKIISLITADSSCVLSKALRGFFGKTVKSSNIVSKKKLLI